MKCDEASRFLDAYLDRELEAGKRFELEQHLTGCGDCRTWLEQQRQFIGIFKANALYYQAPAELRARVQRRAETDSRGRKFIFLARRPWLYAAALLVLSLSLAWMIFSPDRETKTLIVQAVSDHSRAVLLERLCDVVSPDPAVLKQSLLAKLEFAPLVMDLPGTAFRMRGGRVDVIQDRKVAVLVYQRNEDLVSLFAWPATGRLLAARDWSISGYRACTWNAANFNFVAVSTLSDHDLDEFTDQIRDRLK
ncbi:MAG TPA: zf-HC2 domain-containing protein [Chthoniobacterales bacterium]|nr:zf-HC2 domain-containing protein [Chthoniobacterales bacterium]